VAAAAGPAALRREPCSSPPGGGEEHLPIDLTFFPITRMSNFKLELLSSFGIRDSSLLYGVFNRKNRAGTVVIGNAFEKLPLLSKTPVVFVVQLVIGSVTLVAVSQE
jgi:hypothetical protein